MPPVKRSVPLTHFNAKAGDRHVSRVFALASEVSPKSRGAKLMPAAEMVETLMQKGFITLNRAALVHHDVSAAQANPGLYDVPAEITAQNLLGALVGKSDYGVNFYPVAVGGRHNKEKMLLVIEDVVTGRSVVLGDKADKPRRTTEGNVQFIARGPSATKKLMGFFTEGARYRGERNLLSVGNVQAVIESMISSYSLISNPPRDMAERTDDGGLLIQPRTTIGAFISRSKLEPLQYNRIVKR